MNRALRLTLLATLIGCGPAQIDLVPRSDDDTDPTDTGPEVVVEPNDTGETGETGETGDTEVEPEPDYSMYDGANLIVREPKSASIYYVHQGLPFDASIVDAQNQPLPFNQIGWTVLNTRTPTYYGLKGLIEQPDLLPGIYSIDVLADLPNGNRLRQTVNEVRVQTWLTGIWVGTVHLSASIEFNNLPLQADCIGAITFQVPLDGSQIRKGSGGCSLVLGGLGSFDFDISLTGNINDPNVTGNASVGVSLAQVPMPLKNSGFGGRTPHFRGYFGGEIVGIKITGEINTELITPWYTP